MIKLDVPRRWFMYTYEYMCVCVCVWVYYMHEIV